MDPHTSLSENVNVLGALTGQEEEGRGRYTYLMIASIAMDIHIDFSVQIGTTVSAPSLRVLR